MSFGLKRIALAAGLAATSIASPVKAEDSGFYLTGSVGISNQAESSLTEKANTANKYEIDYSESSRVFNGGLGYDFGNFRVEATLDHKNGDVDALTVTAPAAVAKADASGNYSIKSIFLSAYYDIPLGDSKFSPYIGGGIGKSTLDIESITYQGATTDGDSDDQTSYQGTIGVSYATTESSDVFVQGTYQTIGKASIDGDLGCDVDDITNLGVSMGLRFKF